MQPASILETVLYAPDPVDCAAFYERVVGLSLAREPNERFAVLRVNADAVLLIFSPAVANTAGRGAPPHGPDPNRPGCGHIAFRVDDLDAWRTRLVELGVAIEMEVERSPPDWPLVDGRSTGSIYLRDPACNSVELIDGDIWR